MKIKNSVVDDFIGIGITGNVLDKYPSGITGYSGSYIYNNNSTKFVNAGSNSNVGFEFVYVSGDTGPVTLGTIGLSGMYNCRNLVPDSSLTYDLGDNTNRWKSMYVGPGTINFLGNTGTATATIGVNQLGFVYTPQGFTTPIANLGAKETGNPLVLSGGWAFTSDTINNSIIYELTEGGIGITGTTTYLNYKNERRGVLNSDTIQLGEYVSSCEFHSIDNISVLITVTIPDFKNQPLTITNSYTAEKPLNINLKSNNTNGKIYFRNSIYNITDTIPLGNESITINWSRDTNTNSVNIFIFGQNQSNPYNYLGYNSSRVKWSSAGGTSNYYIELPNNYSNVFLLCGDSTAPNFSGNNGDISIYGIKKPGRNGQIITLLFNYDDASNLHVTYHNQVETLDNDHHGFLISRNSSSLNIYNQGAITLMFSTDYFGNSGTGWYMIHSTN
jgi:hypothetical protein